MARVWPWMAMIAIVGVAALAPSLTSRAADDPIADRKANRKEVGEQAKAIKAVLDAGGPAASRQTHPIAASRRQRNRALRSKCIADRPKRAQFWLSTSFNSAKVGYPSGASPRFS